jgi:hypothetical protein
MMQSPEVLVHAAAGELISDRPHNHELRVTRTGTRGGACPVALVSRSGALFYSPARASRVMGCDVARSRDGGASFERLQTPREPAHLPDDYVPPRLKSLHPKELARMAEELAPGATFHPGLWMDPASGRVFVTTTHKSAFPDGSGSIVAFTDDDGETWSHTPVGEGSWDWGKLSAGPAATARGRAALQRSGYPSMLYFSATGPTLIFGPNQQTYRSSDGGVSWQRTADMFDAERVARLDVGFVQAGVVAPDGAIYATWAGTPADYVADTDKSRIPVHVVRSLDEGDSWQHFDLPETRTQVLGARIAITKDSALVLTWADQQDGQIRLSLSRDRAETWSEPRMLRIPGVARAAKPTIAVSAEGTLALACWGSTQAEGHGDGWLRPDRRPYNGYLVLCHDITAPRLALVTGVVRDGDEPLLPKGESAFHSGEYIGAPSFAPDGSVWAGFLSAAAGGIVARLSAAE